MATAHQLSLPDLALRQRNCEVDTHKDVHVVAVLTTLGVLLSNKNFPATAAGYQALLDWVGTFGVLRRAGVECTGLLRCGAGPVPAGGVVSR